MSGQKRSDTDEMTFAEHIDALRPHLVRGVLAILALAVAAFLCKGLLIDGVLFGPMSAGFPTNRLLVWMAGLAGIEFVPGIERMQLINTAMAGQFNLHLKISMVAAFCIGFPYLLWELWRFARPALTERELRGCRRFVFYVSAGFFAGLLFGYFIIAPLTIGFLSQYSVSEQVTNMIDVSSYLSTVLNVSIACAVVFQLPLLVYFLTRMGLVSPDFLRRYRRHALVALAILSAVITPARRIQHDSGPAAVVRIVRIQHPDFGTDAAEKLRNGGSNNGGEIDSERTKEASCFQDAFSFSRAGHATARSISAPFFAGVRSYFRGESGSLDITR